MHWFLKGIFFFFSQILYLEENLTNCKNYAGRKTKEERRIGNRQKLLLLKRHSGFLKRPEILETVYSIEEDGDQIQQLQHQQNKQQQQQQILHQKNQAKPHPLKLSEPTSIKFKELTQTSSGSCEGSNGSTSSRPCLLRSMSLTSNESPCVSRRGSISCFRAGHR